MYEKISKNRKPEQIHKKCLIEQKYRNNFSEANDERKPRPSRCNKRNRS